MKWLTKQEMRKECHTLDFIPNYAECFVCGESNKKGLKNRFWVEDGCVTTRFHAKNDHVGHGAIHGGISVALLDETMGLSATITKNRLCVTLELSIRYLKPLMLNNIYTVRGCLVSDKNILCETRGEIIDSDCNILVQATGKYVPLSEEKSHQIHPNVFKSHKT
jgi:uncharacterized protein (TIGR00369 family)